jgi:membrane protein required for colicin V production
MTLYDLIFLGALLFSLFMGVARGGTRELITLIAFFLALLIASWLYPWLVKTFNLGDVVGFIAVIFVFVGCYFGIRYLGQSLSDKLQKGKVTNIADRVLGFGFGIVRTLVFLGAFHLIFSAVTPIERQPLWFRSAKVYPLSVWCAKTIQTLLPGGTKIANKVAPSVEKSF